MFSACPFMNAIIIQKTMLFLIAQNYRKSEYSILKNISLFNTQQKTKRKCVLSSHFFVQKQVINFINMAKHVKNLQLFSEKHTQMTTKERSIKPDPTRGKLYDINYWRIFSKMPKNDCTLNKLEIKQQQSQNQHNKLIVISTFKNNQVPTDIPIKKIKNFKNPIKRYISDQGLNFTKKVSPNHIMNEEQSKIELVKNTCKPQKTSQKQPLSCQDLERSSMLTCSKRTAASGNQSEVNTKYRINRNLTKLKKGAAVQRMDSSRKLPDVKSQKKYPLLMRDPEELKQVKSQSYIVLQYPSERIIVSHRSVVSLEIASLTKIMTFYTVFCIIQEKNIDIKTETITVTHEASNMTGTSAQLIEGETYTIQDLLYGLMLPSGNDAANQLAFWGGSFLVNTDDLRTKQKAFINQMNKRARILGLKNSKFANAHGLPHHEARSTAADIAKLCCVCMKIQLFKTIVSCQKYKTLAKYQSITRQVQWENTNKLLRRDGFLGLKTGITVTAGPCLAAAFSFRDKIYISVVLRAPKVSGRFKETRILLNWCLNKLLKNLSDQQKKKLKKLKRNDQELDSDYSEDQHEFNYDCSGANQYKKRANILSYQL